MMQFRAEEASHTGSVANRRGWQERMSHVSTEPRECATMLMPPLRSETCGLLSGRIQVHARHVHETQRLCGLLYDADAHDALQIDMCTL